MPKIIWLIGTGCTICALVLGIRAKISIWEMRRNTEDQRNILTARNEMFWVGLLIGVAASLVGFVDLCSKTTLAEVILASGFAMISIVCVYVWLKHMIIYDENGFSVGWFRFHMKYYLYEDVLGYTLEEIKARDKIIYNKIYYFKDVSENGENRNADIRKHKVQSIFFKDAFNAFEKNLFQTYKEVYKKELEEIDDLVYGEFALPKEKYVRTKSNIAGVAAFMVMISFALVWGLYGQYEYVDETNTEHIQAHVNDAWYWNDMLYLQTNMRTHSFRIHVTEENEELLHQLYQNATQKESISFYVIKTGGKYDTYYLVYHAEDKDGTVYTTFDDVNAIQRGTGSQYIGVVAAVFLALAFILASMCFSVRQKKK